MAPEVDYLEQPSNQILNLYNMLLEIEKIEKELCVHYGLQELMQELENVGLSYSVLVNGLNKSNILLDRKILSDLAINDASTFEKIVKTAVN